MAYLTLDRARAGMVLASDVLDRRGRLLVPRGRELTERHLGALRMWGVVDLEIEGDAQADESAPPVDPAILAVAEQETTDLFANAAESHPFLDALRRLTVERRARALASEARP